MDAHGQLHIFIFYFTGVAPYISGHAADRWQEYFEVVTTCVEINL